MGRNTLSLEQVDLVRVRVTPSRKLHHVTVPQYMAQPLIDRVPLHVGGVGDLLGIHDLGGVERSLNDPAVERKRRTCSAR